MATKASENKAAKTSAPKPVAVEGEPTTDADFLAGFEGKALSVETFEEAYPGRGREIFDTVSKVGRYGYFPGTATLARPKKAAARRKINEAIAKLNLGAK